MLNKYIFQWQFKIVIFISLNFIMIIVIISVILHIISYDRFPFSWLETIINTHVYIKNLLHFNKAVCNVFVSSFSCLICNTFRNESWFGKSLYICSSWYSVMLKWLHLITIVSSNWSNCRWIKKFSQGCNFKVSWRHKKWPLKSMSPVKYPATISWNWISNNYLLHTFRVWNWPIILI